MKEVFKHMKITFECYRGRNPAVSSDFEKNGFPIKAKKIHKKNYKIVNKRIGRYSYNIISYKSLSIMA